MAERFLTIGLSPRGRGNLQLAQEGDIVERSIPAWAGQPLFEVFPFLYSEVYPRVGGATGQPKFTLILSNGLSPRGRGNPNRLPQHLGDLGSIPAWAGQPVWLSPVYVPLGVYPRVGGATPFLVRLLPFLNGLSPRGRGNHRDRGNRYHRKGSIPAWAGQPGWSPGISTATGVYPRVGGATYITNTYRYSIFGLSPRGRGNQDRISEK